MKQFFEFIPLIIFFIVYKMVDIYAATGSLIITTGLLLAYNYFKHGKVEKMHVITFLMVLIFGSLTLVLHNDLFIKWKVTAVYALFSIALLASQYIFKKPIIKQMLGKEITLPDKVWKNLNLAWAVFFFILGLLNIYVAFYMAEDIWVNFKVFGLLGATIVFTLISGVYIYKYLPKDEEKIKDKVDADSK
ncbi:septation protein A [Psychromonas sp. GE-S-Ul-11]|uniref:septation protein A n=1 Tax=Psychromonas sp. GE-S-Ul-11 TaxID=3241170 RepID=UPI00390C5E14